MIKRFGAKAIYLDGINERLRLAYCHLPCYYDLLKPLIVGPIESDSNDNSNKNNDNGNDNTNGSKSEQEKTKNDFEDLTKTSSRGRGKEKNKQGKRIKRSPRRKKLVINHKKSKRTKIIENDSFERNEDMNRVFSLYHYEGKLEFIKESLNHSLKIIASYQGVDITKCQKPPKTAKEYNFKAVNWFNQQRTKISGILAQDFLQQFKLRYIAPNVKPMFQGILTVSVEYLFWSFKQQV